MLVPSLFQFTLLLNFQLHSVSVAVCRVFSLSTTIELKFDLFIYLIFQVTCSNDVRSVCQHFNINQQRITAKFHWKIGGKNKKKRTRQAISCLTMENIFLHIQQQFLMKLCFSLRFSSIQLYISFSSVLPLSFRQTVNIKRWALRIEWQTVQIKFSNEKKPSPIEGKMNESVDKTKSAWDLRYFWFGAIKNLQAHGGKLWNTCEWWSDIRNPNWTYINKWR